MPQLITHVVTTDATKTDVEATKAIHQALAQRDVLPAKHIVDAGYVDAQLVLQSQQRYGIELIGPVSQNRVTSDALLWAGENLTATLWDRRSYQSDPSGCVLE